MKLSVIAMIVSAFMMLEACTETVQKQKIPGATYMGGNNTITEICKELDSAGAAHVDIFREWAVDFADSAGKMRSWKIHGQILENESGYR